jgi:hypothetical protein
MAEVYQNSISGKALSLASTTERALVAHSLTNGGIYLRGLSYDQARRLTHVSPNVLTAVNHAGAETREKLAKGEAKLSAVINAHESTVTARRLRRIAKRLQENLTPDALADLFLSTCGPEVALCALDRLTTKPAANAET